MQPRYVNYSYTREGSPLKLLMPSKPGDYEIRYILGQDRTVLASRPITLSAVEADLQFADTATIGSSIVIDWSGPDAQNDYIDVADQNTGRYHNYSYTSKGSPLKLLMPPKPGIYDIRYVMGQDRTVLVTKSIIVEAVEVSLIFDESVTISDSDNARKLLIDWTGPDAHNDYVQLSKEGGTRAIDWAYTKNGTPILLDLPAEEGVYEISYILGQGKKILEIRPINIVMEE